MKFKSEINVYDETTGKMTGVIKLWPGIDGKPDEYIFKPTNPCFVYTSWDLQHLNNQIDKLNKELADDKEFKDLKGK